MWFLAMYKMLLNLTKIGISSFKTSELKRNTTPIHNFAI